MKALSAIVPMLLLLIPLYGLYKKVDIYEAFVEGARDGLKLAASVFPYLASMLIAISVLRASGAMDAALGAIQNLAGGADFPAEALPIALIRPLSGSGALGMLTDLFRTLGPDSRAALVGACVMGSSETIFYTLSVYCGSAKIVKTRYLVPLSLLSSLASALVAFWIC